MKKYYPIILIALFLLLPFVSSAVSLGPKCSPNEDVNQDQYCRFCASGESNEELGFGWKVPGVDQSKSVCFLTCTRSDGRDCTVYREQGGYAVKLDFSLSMWTNLNLKPVSAIKIKATTTTNRAVGLATGNVYQMSCCEKSNYSNPGLIHICKDNTVIKTSKKIVVTGCCSKLPTLQTNPNPPPPYIVSGFPGIQGGDGRLRGSQDFMNRFYKLYQKMQDNNPTPDPCNPLKFNDGYCYISGIGQYRSNSGGSHTNLGAVDIVCDRNNNGSQISTSSSDTERCRLVNELINRVKSANGEAQFSGIRECTRAEWIANNSSALHLHLDLETTVDGEKPCLIQNANFMNCVPFV